MPRLRILVADDDPTQLGIVRRLLADADVDVARDANEALLRLREYVARKTPYDALLADHHMRRLSGSELLVIARAESPTTRRILVSGDASVEAPARARGDAHAFLAKPLDARRLLDALAG